MDRLEQILHAENRADKVLDSANEQARSILAQAKSEAELVVGDAEREARAEAVSIADRARSETEREAEALAQAEASKMRASIESAEGRVEAAAQTVLRELTD